MKRFIILLLALLFTSVAVNAQQSYEILLTINGDALYSDANGDWLTRGGSIKKYGRKDFKAHFRHPYYYDHVVERGYIRTYFRETFKTVVGGDMEWSRVLESDLPIDVLKRKAVSNMDNVTYEDEASISGVILEHRFIPDHNGRFYGLISCVWSANVTYEFKEGRYKVTLSNIECTSNTEETNTYFSSSTYLGHNSGHAVSVHQGKDIYQLASLMYLDESLYNSQELWNQVTNFFDRNFTVAVILSSYAAANDEDNDW